MISLLVTYTCKKGMRDLFLKAIKDEKIDLSCKGEDGNLMYDYFKAVDSADTLVLVEKWKDEASLAAHGKQDHYLRLGVLKAKFVDSTEVERFEVC